MLDLEHVEWTPIQSRILSILRDGQPHVRAELAEVIKPSSPKSLSVTLTLLRKRLSRLGLDIVTYRINPVKGDVGGRYRVRLVRLYTED